MPSVEIGARHAPGARPGGNDGSGLPRREALDPRAAVSEGDADEHVREGGLQAVDAQGLPAQALRPQAPGLHGGVTRRPGRDRGHGLHRAGEDGIERQAHLAEHRRLPQHAELAGPVLPQVEVGRPDLVRVARERHQQRRQGHEDREPPHGRTSTWLARGPSHGRTDGSTTTWYFRIRP